MMVGNQHPDTQRMSRIDAFMAGHAVVYGNQQIRLFTGGDQAVVNTNTVTVTYTTSLTSS